MSVVVFGPDVATEMEALRLPVNEHSYNEYYNEYYELDLQALIKGTTQIVNYVNSLGNSTPDSPPDTLEVISDGKESRVNIVWAGPAPVRRDGFILLTESGLWVRSYSQTNDQENYRWIRSLLVNNLAGPIILACCPIPSGFTGIDFCLRRSSFLDDNRNGRENIWLTSQNRVMRMDPPLVNFTDDGYIHVPLARNPYEALFGFWNDPRTAHLNNQRGPTDNTAPVDPGITGDPKQMYSFMREALQDEDVRLPPKAFRIYRDPATDRARRPWAYSK